MLLLLKAQGSRWIDSGCPAGRDPGCGQRCHGSAASWLTQQAHYDLAQVRADRIKLKRLQPKADP
jgi:hypothetical protein